jgi:hypothetical protein
VTLQNRTPGAPERRFTSCAPIRVRAGDRHPPSGVRAPTLTARWGAPHTST